MLRKSLLAGFLLLSTSVLADDLKIRFPVEKYTLANGLTVLLHEDHTVPMVSYHTWYRVGSRDEQVGTTGAAHMLEHMMFKGAKKYSGKEFDHILHANGITNNAFTSWDYTGFYENLPSSKLELIMDMEVDRMRFLALNPDDLKSELQVVAEERRWRVDNNPMGLLREALFGVAFTKSPYRWPVIGYMSDIQAYTTEKLKYFYDKYYVPNNAVLVIAGDFETAKVKKMIEKYYGVLKESPLAERTYAQDPLPTKPVRKVVESEVQTSTAMLAYPGVASGHIDSYALDLLASILGAGSSSRLYKKLVYQDQIATSAVSYNMTNAASGLFTLSVGLKPGQNEANAERLMKAEVKRLLASAVTQKELEKSKAQLMKDFVDGLMTIDGKAQALALNEILFGTYDKLFTDLEKYKAVTLQDIQRVAKDYLKPEREIVVVLKPKSAKVSAIQGAGQ
ncbi:MAG: M16 family metallopeptidase [Bdellovibrio sp.]